MYLRPLRPSCHGHPLSYSSVWLFCFAFSQSSVDLKCWHIFFLIIIFFFLLSLFIFIFREKLCADGSRKGVEMWEISKKKINIFFYRNIFCPSFMSVTSAKEKLIDMWLCVVCLLYCIPMPRRYTTHSYTLSVPNFIIFPIPGPWPRLWVLYSGWWCLLWALNGEEFPCLIIKEV